MSARLLALSHSELMAQHEDLGVLPSPLPPRQPQQRHGDIVAVDEELAARAMSGWRRYGKGRHPAALNFGDCFTYALAEQTGYPVLCTGDDFAATCGCREPMPPGDIRESRLQRGHAAGCGSGPSR